MCVGVCGCVGVCVCVGGLMFESACLGSSLVVLEKMTTMKNGPCYLLFLICNSKHSNSVKKFSLRLWPKM